MKTARASASGKGRQQDVRQAGFSLVELLVAMVVMIVILGAIFTIWLGVQRTYSFTNEDMTAQAQARSALSEMVTAIRTARQPSPAPSETLNMVIVSAQPNSLICWTDIDREPTTGLNGLELVRFRVDIPSRTLYMDTLANAPYDTSFATAHTERLVGNWVSNDPNSTPATPLFKYRSANGGAPADPTQIREIVIDLAGC